MKIFALESSCDETSGAIVDSAGTVFANIVNSQIDIHSPYGGVVPEIASREHVRNIQPVIQQTLDYDKTNFNDIDAIAVTYGPGLASSLLIGLSAAKSLSMVLDKPLIGVNHLKAHIYSAFLDNDLEFDEMCPFLALVVSGGHTSIVEVNGLNSYKLLGQTIDDAAGEAFDKAAKLLNLGYPGGPIIDKLATSGNKKFVAFPKCRPSENSMGLNGLNPKLCFSFSGLKTALMYYLKKTPLNGSDQEVCDIAASYQEAIVSALETRCELALKLKPYKAFAIGGGVSLNSALRTRMTQLAQRNKVPILLAKPKYCGDNAAMIAGLAAAGGGIVTDEETTIDATPSLPI
jgi:N6-L-threonylcarbamoyladenine synthase